MKKIFRKSLFILAGFVSMCFVLSGCSLDFYKEIDNPIFKKVVSVEVLDQDTAKAAAIEYESLALVQEEVYYYLYEGLEIEQKKLYNEIYDSLLCMKDETIVSTTDEAELKKIFEYVMMDHPEIFYADGYQFTRYYIGDILTKIGFVGNYKKTVDEVTACMEEINSEVDSIMTQVSQYEDEYYKAKFIYDYLILNTDYVLDSPDDQNICSVFINKESVCQGYSKAYQLLMQKCGMVATLVSGSTNNDGHSWVLVKVNDNFYYVDPTWGDASYILADDISEEYKNMDFSKGINYDYFLVTTKDIQKTHSFDAIDLYPECLSETDNYYVKENLYFDFWDFERFANIMLKAYEEGQNEVTIKCKDEVALAALNHDLIEEQGIFEVLELDNKGIAYSFDENQHTFTIWF